MSNNYYNKNCTIFDFKEKKDCTIYSIREIECFLCNLTDVIKAIKIYNLLK